MNRHGDVNYGVGKTAECELFSYTKSAREAITVGVGLKLP